MSTNDLDDDPRHIALLQLLRTAEAIWKASRVFFERWNLSPSQFNVLNLLRLHAEGLSQTELSKLLLMHRSNVTGLVDQLEGRGLVRREEAAGDRRAYRVRLTSSGSKLLAGILPSYFDGAIRVWRDISARRAEQLTETLANVASHVERIARENAEVPHPAVPGKAAGRASRDLPAGRRTDPGTKRP